MSTEVASMDRSIRRRMRDRSPRAAPWASLGMSTSPRAPMKAVGRQSMGMVMPHSTPNSSMARLTSAPAATSRWGMSTALAEPIRLPSRLVNPTGRAMARICRFIRREAPGSPSFSPASLRRASSTRVMEEKSSHTIMPATMRATVRSGFWGRKRTSSPSTAAARITCSHSSTAAGGRMAPVP